MVKQIFLLLFLVALISIIPEGALAQCAMCKATLEAGGGQKGTIGAGLNTGILYLMSVPYIAFSVLAILWYRNAKAKKKPIFSRKGLE